MIVASRKYFKSAPPHIQFFLFQTLYFGTLYGFESFERTLIVDTAHSQRSTSPDKKTTRVPPGTLQRSAHVDTPSLEGHGLAPRTPANNPNSRATTNRHIFLLAVLAAAARTRRHRRSLVPPVTRPRPRSHARSSSTSRSTKTPSLARQTTQVPQNVLNCWHWRSVLGDKRKKGPQQQPTKKRTPKRRRTRAKKRQRGRTRTVTPARSNAAATTPGEQRRATGVMER
jgi:hypothetical protein